MSRSKFLLDSANPDDIYNVLLYSKSEILFSRSDIVERLHEKGYKVGARFGDSLSRMIDIDILEREGNGTYLLSKLGEELKVLALVNPTSFYEMLHYIQYFKTVDRNSPPYFWTYRFLVDMLYSLETVPNRKYLAQEILQSLHLKLDKYSFGFDDTSVTKGMRWIRMLTPSPIERDYIRLRESGLAYGLLWAIANYYRENNLHLGYPLLLNESTKTRISMSGMLASTTTDRLIQQLVSQGDLRQNYGSAGESIILDMSVDLISLIRRLV